MKMTVEAFENDEWTTVATFSFPVEAYVRNLLMRVSLPMDFHGLDVWLDDLSEEYDRTYWVAVLAFMDHLVDYRTNCRFRVKHDKPDRGS